MCETAVHWRLKPGGCPSTSYNTARHKSRFIVEIVERVRWTHTWLPVEKFQVETIRPLADSNESIHAEQSPTYPGEIANESRISAASERSLSPPSDIEIVQIHRLYSIWIIYR